MRKKIRRQLQTSSMVLGLLLLASCSKEAEMSSPTEVKDKTEKHPAESIHFDLKEDNNTNFQLIQQSSQEALSEDMFPELNQAVENLNKSSQNQNEEVQENQKELVKEKSSLEETEINHSEGDALLNLNKQLEDSKEENHEMNLPSYGEEFQEESHEQLPPSNYPYDILDVKLTSKEVQQWVEERKKEKGAYVRDDGEKKLLLIAGGEKPNTGYQLKLNGIYDKGKHIEVHFSTIEPNGNQVTLQVLTYPTLLISIPKTNKAIDFIEDL